MISDLKKIQAILTPAEQRKALGMLLLVVMMAVAETLGVLSIMPFLSALARPQIVAESFWLKHIFTALGFVDVRSFIITLGIASTAIVIVSSGFKTVTQHILNRFVHFLRHSLASRLLSRYLHQPYEFFLSRNTAELSKNVLTETDIVSFNLIQPMAQMIAQGAIVIAMALLIVLYDPLMAVAILSVVGLLYAAIYGLVRRRLARIGHELVAANQERYQTCNEALSGIRDIKITHSAHAYQARFLNASHTYARHLATNETLTQTPLYLVEAVGYTGLIVIALALLARGSDVAHVLPVLGLYGFAAYRMLPAAQIIYRGFAKLKLSSASLELLHHDLTLHEEILINTENMLTPRHEIRLQGVCFAYPSAPEVAVLDDFDLVIPAQTSFGIVGRSGAGKSTLMDLMLGLLQPQAGSLSVDGTPIDAKNIASWQRAIGYVPQHIYLADASIAENIAFGVDIKNIDMQAVERAACAAQIHDFITNDLAQGYDTKIGERGIRLSGGQRQRIGIARALYRDPPVLFFDEATSALDTQTEETLNEAVRNLSGEKTVVVIAHREASLRNCQYLTLL